MKGRVSLALLIERAKQKLNAVNIESYDVDARFLARHVFSMESAQLISQSGNIPKTDLRNRYEACIERRLAGEPVARIIGLQEFYGLEFQLSPETLIPRADTEILVDWILDYYSKSCEALRLLDLGTGSGAILISLLKNLSWASGVGTDINKLALNTALANAKDHSVDGRCEFILSDWCDEIDNQFDVVVSNPPYIQSTVIKTLKAEVRDFDPVLALDGGANGLVAYRKIFDQCRKVLNPGGRLVLEIGFDQLNSVSELAQTYCWRIIDQKKDFGGNNRMIAFEHR